MVFFFFFWQVTFWICSPWHIYVYMHFASPYFMILKSNVTDFSFLYDFFFFLWLSSISLLDFFANLLFLNSLFFPFIFLLNMTPGANSKKNADDITSNDRGEDEGIFLFFFLQSSILMHDFISFFFFPFQPVFPPLIWREYTSVWFFVFFLFGDCCHL